MTIFEVQCATADFFGIRLDAMLGDAKFQGVARVRQIAMWAAFKTLDKSTPQIGASFARDHTTVIHAIQTIDRLVNLADDPWGKSAWALLERLLDAGDGKRDQRVDRRIKKDEQRVWDRRRNIERFGANV